MAKSNASLRRRQYDWRADFHHSWLFYLRRMALAIGSVHFTTIEEMYFQESRGVIP